LFARGKHVSLILRGIFVVMFLTLGFAQAQTTQQTLTSGSFAVAPRTSQGGPSSCNFHHEQFNAPAGAIAGSVQSDNAIDFILVSLSSYNGWILSGTGSNVRVKDCFGPKPWIEGKEQTTAYNFTANLASSGDYVIVLLNTSVNLAHVKWTISST